MCLFVCACATLPDFRSEAMDLDEECDVGFQDWYDSGCLDLERLIDIFASRALHIHAGFGAG